MNKYLTSLFLVLAITAHAQTPTLDITGLATINHQPNQCVVTYQIQRQSSSYETALNSLNEDIVTLTKSLLKQGFEQKEIITQQFDISKNRRYANGKWIDEGYIANQRLNVVFAIDQKRLIKVLSTSTSSGSNPEVSIRFEIDEATRAKIQKELIKLAVADAREKADIISEAAGYKVTGIEQINYGSSNQPVTPAVYRMAENTLAADTGFGPMEAEAIKLSDRVQIKFVIAPQ
jgi:uncharacterized protein YggE